jgi:hypothetical protein
MTPHTKAMRNFKWYLFLLGCFSILGLLFCFYPRGAETGKLTAMGFQVGNCFEVEFINDETQENAEFYYRKQIGLFEIKTNPFFRKGWTKINQKVTVRGGVIVSIIAIPFTLKEIETLCVMLNGKVIHRSTTALDQPQRR